MIKMKIKRKYSIINIKSLETLIGQKTGWLFLPMEVCCVPITFFPTSLYIHVGLYIELEHLHVEDSLIIDGYFKSFKA